MDVRMMFKGVAMGMAEAVPGVSGGTIAFITGIYHRLLKAIKGFDPSLFAAYKREGLRGVLKQVDFFFLISLGVGMLGGILIGVFGVHYLMERYPPVVWSFFFGLILASFFYLLFSIGRLRIVDVLLMILGLVVAAAISFLSPLNGSDHLLYVFISGFLAISALMLPGVSGAFILLLLGMYMSVIGHVKSFVSAPNGADMLFLAVLGLGCVFGVVVLSRGLSYLLEFYRSPTLSLLTGFILGSLVKIWPWQNPIILLDKEEGGRIPFGGQDLSTDRFKVIDQAWVWPDSFYDHPYLLYSLVAAILGFGLVWMLSRVEKE